jgi:acetyl-CoA C-acetyltransferase
MALHRGAVSDDARPSGEDLTMDPRQPVLIGAGQTSNRVDRGAEPLEPVDLIAEVLRAAEAETGAAGVLAGADTVGVVNLLSWRYRDPGALVAERVGASPRRSLGTTGGGQSPQMLVNLLANDIVAGRCDLALVAGAECWRTRQAFRGKEAEQGWTVQGDDVPSAEEVGPEFDLFHPVEASLGLFLPVIVYPLFEVARRAHLGLGLDEHVDEICALWSRFSEVAAQNPDAWIQRSFRPDELRAVTPENRMVAAPYRKLLNSNNMVEQAAGLVVCSAERAAALGVPRDRWVFLHAGADAADAKYVSLRGDLHSSPAMRVAGRTALDLAGVGPDELAHVDLYSCFPSAVQIAADELGLGTERQLTVTGGMSFAGGPWNDYTMHGIATMAHVLRDDPGSSGLCSANGGYLTKHSFGVYGTEPPAEGFRWESPQAKVDAFPQKELAEGHEGEVVIESATVLHDREGQPERAFVATLLPDGRRAWGTSVDGEVMSALLCDECVGRSAHLRSDESASLTLV